MKWLDAKRQIYDEELHAMNNVAGVDVSKGKSMVTVLRPFGEVVAKPFSVGHTGSELKELADYLGVQRPSLFRELKKMKDEGIIEISKRTIRL